MPGQRLRGSVVWLVIIDDDVSPSLGGKRLPPCRYSVLCGEPALKQRLPDGV